MGPYLTIGAHFERHCRGALDDVSYHTPRLYVLKEDVERFFNLTLYKKRRNATKPGFQRFNQVLM